MTLLVASRAWHDAGCAVLPAMLDGSKRPALPEWKTYQTTRPTPTALTGWFLGGHAGLGVLCGTISGGLEMLEFEGRAITEGALQMVAELIGPAGLDELWARVTTGGYAEHTPSGGLHLLYRIADAPVPGNTKLARRPATAGELEENPTDRVKVLAETRGEGGWVVVAPSSGTTHATGIPWTTIYGSPATIPTITMAERDELHRIIRCLDDMPVAAPVTPEPPRLRSVDGGISPGDDYEQKTTWRDILAARGWRALWERGGRTYWKRPGKDTSGISATTGGATDGRDRLYVFTSASEFDAEQPYTKFGAYAVLEHGGDHKVAASALRKAGFGAPLPISPDPAAEHRAAIADLIPPGRPGAPDPRVLTAVDGTAARVLADPETAPAPEEFGPTEDGMALALVAHHGTELRYCPQRGTWLHWDAHRWAWDEGEQHREHVRDLARQLPAGETSELRMWRKRALSSAGITGITRLAQTDQRIVVPFSKLDSDPWSLNTPSGVIDLRTGMMAPPNPEQHHTRTTACAPDDAADQSVWLQFLTDTFGGDQELIGYLQRLVGYSAVGLVGPHVLPFAHGSGGNGKGVFLEAVAGVLGDYATTAPVGFLMAQAHTGHETEIARLAGARMVICSEVNETDSFDEAKVKQLTGGDTLTARFMRQDHFSFTPTHHLWLMGNHKPAVRSGGRAFWRRLRLIPFLHEVPEDQMVEDLQGVLIRDHGPAILAWIAQGAAAYHTGGLREPQAVKVATAEYAKDQDNIGQFVEECALLGGAPVVQIKTTVFRGAYEQWCYAQGEKPVSAKALTTALKTRFGIDQDRTSTARFYVGLSLAGAENEPENEPEKLSSGLSPVEPREQMW